MYSCDIIVLYVSDIVMEAEVLFDYEKQEEDELDLAVGDTITNVTQVMCERGRWNRREREGGGGRIGGREREGEGNRRERGEGE